MSPHILGTEPQCWGSAWIIEGLQGPGKGDGGREKVKLTC